ncbi:MAG: hypothetical protein GY820_03495 [Gammaproteobacteria bacterium]|nr:hypothetical protein [Gammaproteobacteria bacterium]
MYKNDDFGDSNIAILAPKMVPHGSEVFFPPCASRELSIKKKFDPIRSNIKKFLLPGLRGEIWYQYRHLPSGKGSA